MPLRLKPEVHSPKQSFTFSPSPEPSPPPSPSEAVPPAVWLPERDMKTFGAYPLGDIGGMELGRGVIRCGKCGRVGLESAVADHASE
jgi:SAGA-associated factor 73